MVGSKSKQTIIVGIIDKMPYIFYNRISMTKACRDASYLLLSLLFLFTF